MKKPVKVCIYLFLILTLTILTQVGGIAIILGLITSRYIEFRFNKAVICSCFYLLITFIIVPLTAPIFGREPVENSDKIKPTNYLTILLNRNYVTPQLNSVLSNVSKELPPNFEVRYLDANFPFWDGFPLLPHISHNDGKKIDFSLMYQSSSGQVSNLKPSVSGYGVFENPLPHEFNQTKVCKEQGYFQYDYPKYLSLGKVNNDISFSTSYTKALVKAILSQPEIKKVFLEKHLIQRMNLNSTKLRFHGCRAVRHDDHIHVQI